MSKEPPRIQSVKWGLLGSWICVPLDATDAEVVAAVNDGAGCPPGTPDALVIDRLYGGFTCGNDESRRHVFVASGEYTYLGPNEPHTPEDRAETWSKLLIPDNGFIGGGPYCADATTEAPKTE